MSERARSWMVFMLIAISGLLAGCVIVLPLLMPWLIDAANAYQVPDYIKEWGGIIIGFYFGASVNLIKDLIGARPSESASAQHTSAQHTLGQQEPNR